MALDVLRTPLLLSILLFLISRAMVQSGLPSLPAICATSHPSPEQPLYLDAIRVVHVLCHDVVSFLVPVGKGRAE